MPATSDIFFEMLPLYLMMAIGYLAGRLFKPDTKSIATLTVFVLSPIVFMLTVAQMEFSIGALLGPFIVFALSVLVSFCVLGLGRQVSAGKTPYLMALISGTSNWGYFGISIAFVLFEPAVVGLYVLIALGTIVFENSFGIYYASRGQSSPLESFKNVFRYPVLYAIIIGVFLSYLEYQPPILSGTFFEYFKGAYIVLGMMMVGLALADMERLTVNIGFLASTFGLRFLIWPALAIGVVWLDKNVIGLMNADFYASLLLISLMPMGANNISFAAKFDMGPGRTAVACLATTLFAMIYIPVAVRFLGL